MWCVHVVVHLSLRINKNDNQKPAGKNKDKKTLATSTRFYQVKYFYFLLLLLRSIIGFRVYAKKYFLILSIDRKKYKVID